MNPCLSNFAARLAFIKCERSRSIWEYGCNISNCFCSSFSEHHTSSLMQKLWVLNKTESTGSVVSSPEVLTVHADNGGSLSCTTTMNCMIDKHVQSLHTATRDMVLSYPLLGIWVVRWWRTKMSPINSQQAVGCSSLATITMPLWIWLHLIYINNK